MNLKSVIQILLIITILIVIFLFFFKYFYVEDKTSEIIIEEMISGVRSTNSNKTISISNRKEAIKAACQFARTNDIILVAGKGHESYQEVKGVRSHFDDFEIVKELLNQKN